MVTLPHGRNAGKKGPPEPDQPPPLFGSGSPCSSLGTARSCQHAADGRGMIHSPLIRTLLLIGESIFDKATVELRRRRVVLPTSP
jgi:hypothetical protein